MNRSSLADKVALVTGSTRGLGRGIATSLACAKCRIVLNYLWDDEEAFRALENLKQHISPETILIRADVTSEKETENLVASVIRTFGSLDIIVINATPEQPHKPLEFYTWQDYQLMLEYFLKSPFLLTRAVLPTMKEKRWGRIITIGSESLFHGEKNFSAYVSAKGALAGWTRSVARELAPFGITVNMVSPGFIPGKRHRDMIGEELDNYLNQTPVTRWGTPGDIGAAVTFLAGDDAGFITGQNIYVSGGTVLL